MHLSSLSDPGRLFTDPDPILQVIPDPGKIELLDKVK